MLGQRMMHHAEAIIRQWAIEVSEQTFYDRIASLSENYEHTFDYYLSAPVHYAGDPECKEDDDRDAVLDEMTRRYYELVDDLYLAVRHKRGINEEPGDYQMMRMEALEQLLEGCRDVDEDKAHQAMAHLILWLANFDTRIGYYPDIQDKVSELVGDSETMYMVLMSLVRDNNPKKMGEGLGEFFQHMVEILPDTGIFNLLVNSDEKREQMAKVYVGRRLNEQAFDGVLMGREDLINDPELHADYDLYNELYDDALAGYEAMIEAGTADDEAYFRAGWCALMVNELGKAEKYMLYRLRRKKPVVEDYLNYAHLCFVKGDKATAYEYYMEARKKAGSIRRFKETFCPDRRVLNDLGIPLQEIYLMEDRVSLI